MYQLLTFLQALASTLEQREWGRGVFSANITGVGRRCSQVYKLHSNLPPQRILILSLFRLKIGINRFNNFGLKAENSF